LNILQIKTLIESINTQLAGELLSIGELKDFVDKAIDDINTRLNTKFPVLSDILDGTHLEYNAIPDKYIRTVVIPGATFKYYITDEEGAAVAPKYEEEYLKGLFYMERDYMSTVPEEYLETDEQGLFYQGHIPDPHFAQHQRCRKEGEFTIDGSVFQL
jgi:hypothetical protein